VKVNSLATLKFNLPVLILFLAFNINAQEIVIQGKVTDANSGDPIPFSNVTIKGTTVGTNTDFDGKYKIKLLKPADSIVASYIGYKSKRKKLSKALVQTIDFQLQEEVQNLQEVVIESGENPAFEILRRVVKNKDKNDKRQLSAYEYDSYSKTEVDIDKISDKFRQKKLMKKVAMVLDSIDRIVGEDGKAILPLFITEAVSRIYYRDNPSLKTEEVKNTKISGVGVEDGSLITQVVGSSFQEYNFYLNWLTILNKNFVSPIADGWRLYYKYDLLDSLYIGGDFCYRIDFFPRSKAELAFEGSMWITKEGYALRQIDATVGREANVNFIERLKIQQELKQYENGAWLPIKNRVLVDVSEVTKGSAGMLAKFYTSNRNFVLNKPKPTSFYEKRVQVAEEAQVNDDDKFWDSLRFEPLSATEKNVYKMIDTLKNIPVVKTYTEVFKALVDGYYDLGKIEVGSYLRTFAWNSIEGLRMQVGFKTNRHYSKKVTYSGFLAYGFKDEKPKFSLGAQYILDRKKWTTLTLKYSDDMVRLGVDEDILGSNPLFLTAARWGNFKRGYYFHEALGSFQKEFFKGFSQKVNLRYHTFDPATGYNFGHIQDPSDPGSKIIERYQFAEVAVESRYARDETFLQNGNERISVGPKKWPIITFRYTHGFKNVFGSDYEYNKLRLNIDKRFKLGPIGVGNLTVTGEKIFNTLPYPLLAVHLGNESPIYSPFTYNLMNFGEFISDQYVTVRYRQFLEGFLVNRLPLLKKLDWRLVGTTNLIFGDLSESNRNSISLYTQNRRRSSSTGYFTGKPYLEVGWGVENIFRFFRVDFVHRLTYLDTKTITYQEVNDQGVEVTKTDSYVPRKFGILFTVQFKL
jgi:hypothetical protein